MRPLGDGVPTLAALAAAAVSPKAPAEGGGWLKVEKEEERAGRGTAGVDSRGLSRVGR